MFFIAVIDFIELLMGGFYCGYASYIGMVYCMFPMLNYSIGCLMLSCWGAGSCACAILAINRCIDVINHDLSIKLFGGKKTVYFLIFPFLYFLYIFFFHPPVIFTSVNYAMFFDPFVGIPERNGSIDSKDVRAF